MSKWLWYFVFIVQWFNVTWVYADGGEVAIVRHAREAYLAKNAAALRDDVAWLREHHAVLTPFADYWLLLLRLHEADVVEVQTFLHQYASLSIADRLSEEWLKKLAGRGEWHTFFEYYRPEKVHDLAVNCFALQGRFPNISADELMPFWLSNEWPSPCKTLFSMAHTKQLLGQKYIWQKARLLLQKNQSITPIYPYLSKHVSALLSRELPKIKADPLIFLHQNHKKHLGTSLKQELTLYALERSLETNTERAIDYYKQAQFSLTDDNRAYGWGRVAWYAARQHHPEALNFYSLSDAAVLQDEQRAWWVRSALRVGDWSLVLKVIEAMPNEQANKLTWQYWRARALQALGGRNESITVFNRLADNDSYYGLLSAEESGAKLPMSQQLPSEAELKAVSQRTGIIHALALREANLIWDAKLEWLWSVRDMDDSMLLASSEYALRQGWYDVAITTAERTKNRHNFKLRYPTLYEALFKNAAWHADVEESWVYGLVRQESRFSPSATSHSGAKGLMQLMPTTAQWMAMRTDLTAYHQDKISDIETNVSLGTKYMAYVLSMMKDQVVATAAYNAGPNRVKQWKLLADPTIYIETIPIDETRDYVQKVMANTYLYGLVHHNNPQSFKSRLGWELSTTEVAP